MSPADIFAFTRRTPFVPFRIHTTDDQHFEIRHPDQVIPMRTRLIVGVTSGDAAPNHVEHLSFFHITRLEEIEAPEPRQAS
jgi:hypothetical protein